MKIKNFIALISCLGTFSVNTKPLLADQILLAHADVKKIVVIKYKPTGTKKLLKQNFSQTEINKK